MQETQQLVDVLKNSNLSIETKFVGTTKRDNWDCFEWKVELKNGSNKMTITFYCGLGHVKKGKFHKPDQPLAPSLADVVYSLVSDADACEQSFEEWCSNLGYNTDSRKDLDLYLQCQKRGQEIRNLMGSELFQAARNAEY